MTCRDMEKINRAMVRAKGLCERVSIKRAATYVRGIAPEKPMHIGETGWASISSGHYGDEGTKASDQYKEKLYYDLLNEWTEQEGISCFYFEAFDEQWKDDDDPQGSENHFGLINLKGEAKYALWDQVDAGAFEGLTRNGYSITKTLNGDEQALLENVLAPPSFSDGGGYQLNVLNSTRNPGETITENLFYLVPEDLEEVFNLDASFPSAMVRINSWEGSCHIELKEGIVHVKTGSGDWWGGAMEITGGVGEDLSKFEGGTLKFDLKGETTGSFEVGYQTGAFADGDQINHAVVFGVEGTDYQISEEWKSYSIPMTELSEKRMFTNIRSLFFVRGVKDFDGKGIEIKDIRYEQ